MRENRVNLTRRGFFLAASSAALLTNHLTNVACTVNEEQPSSQTHSINTREGSRPPLALDPIDRQIWEEELSEFVPEKIFDAHCHLYRKEFDLNYQAALANKEDFTTESVWPDCDLKILKEVENVVMPGRVITRLAFPFPFYRCDFEESNQFIAKEIRQEPGSAALMLVHPSMSAEHVEKTLLREGLLGLKPYSRYCTTDYSECRITDFLPEHQIAVADRYGLLIMMHIGMKKSFADPRNIEDLLRLTEKYPNSKWILAHGARSFAPFPIEKAAPKFRGLPNVWYEVSAVCSMQSFDALFSGVEIDRILYGADSGDVGFERGKSIFFGYSWGDLTARTFEAAGHISPHMTFYIYEQLRAMRRAARLHGLTRSQIEDIFFNSADRLVRSVVPPQVEA